MKQPPTARACLRLGLAALLAWPAAADEVVLVTGGRLLGKATRRAGWVHVELEAGAMAFPDSAVEAVIPGASPAEIAAERRARRRAWLEERLAETDATDAQALYRLAEKARALGFPDEERRAILGLVLGADPDHAGVRAELDQERYDGRWLPRERVWELERRDHAETMRGAGFVRYRGEWMRPDEAAGHRREARLAARIAELKEERASALSQREEARSERDALAGLLSSTESELSAARSEIDRLRGEVDRLSCEVDGLGGRLGACEADLASRPVCGGEDG